MGWLKTAADTPEATYASWMMQEFGQAIAKSPPEGHGPFNSIKFHALADGLRQVFRDMSNGQDYEVVVRVLGKPSGLEKRFDNEWQEGYQAFGDGKNASDCPYTKQEPLKRNLWMDGWAMARLRGGV